MIHTVKSFGVVNKAEVAVFLELPRFSDDPVNAGNLILPDYILYRKIESYKNKKISI